MGLYGIFESVYKTSQLEALIYFQSNWWSLPFSRGCLQKVTLIIFSASTTAVVLLLVLVALYVLWKRKRQGGRRRICTSRGESLEKKGVLLRGWEIIRVVSVKQKLWKDSIFNAFGLANLSYLVFTLLILLSHFFMCFMYFDVDSSFCCMILGGFWML